MWAGLANSNYSIDRKNGVGGYWALQILPFQDVATYPGFVDFESVLYRHLGKAVAQYACPGSQTPGHAYCG